MRHETPSALSESEEDISGFIGMAVRIMDHKGRISFPRETSEFTFNSERIPDALTLTPFLIRSAHDVHLYFIPREFRRERFSAYPNSVFRYPDVTLDKLGRILLNSSLQRIIGKPGSKIFIGFGPYCALISGPQHQKALPAEERQIDRLRLQAEILEQLLRPEIFQQFYPTSCTIATDQIIESILARTRERIQEGRPLYVAVSGDTGSIHVEGTLQVSKRR